MYGQRFDPNSSNSDLLRSSRTMTASQWGRLGAGAALMLAGSGAVSLATLLRLAVFAGGGALAYQAFKNPSLAGEESSAARDVTRSASTRPSEVSHADPSLATHPSMRESLVQAGAEPSSSLAGAGAIPSVDLRGA